MGKNRYIYYNVLCQNYVPKDFGILWPFVNNEEIPYKWNVELGEWQLNESFRLY